MYEVDLLTVAQAQSKHTVSPFDFIGFARHTQTNRITLALNYKKKKFFLNVF